MKTSSKPRAFHTTFLSTDDDSWREPQERAGGEGLLSAPYNWTVLTEIQDLSFSNVTTTHAVCPLPSQRRHVIAADNARSLHHLKWNQCAVLYSLLLQSERFLTKLVLFCCCFGDRVYVVPYYPWRFSCLCLSMLGLKACATRPRLLIFLKGSVTRCVRYSLSQHNAYQTCLY